jgi:hypothetical protein
MTAFATAALADDPLTYTPPERPAAPDPSGLLLRLVLVTAGALAVCAVVMWLARRSQRVAARADPDGRLRHEGSLALDARSAVHLIRVDGQQVAVTTDATGLRSIVLLSEGESFAAALAAAGDPE